MPPERGGQEQPRASDFNCYFRAACAAPPWRTLGALAALVLLAHALLLRLPPSRFGQAPDAAAGRVPVFVTRSVSLPPQARISALPGAASAPAKLRAKTPVRAAKRLFQVQKEVIAQAPPAQAAIDSIASLAPAPDPASAPAAAADGDGASAPIAAAATAPSTEAAPPAASEPAVPPPGPRQTQVTAMALPASARLDYQMSGSAKGLTYHAKGELVWLNTGSAYDARLTVSALFIGSRTMTSTGQVGAEGLAPSRFSDKSKTEVAAHLDADKGQIIFSANTPVLPWVKGAQDRVSVVLQLGGMLAGNPAGFPADSMISLYTVGPRDADSWTFRVEGEERLALPFGELATVKLSRQPRREYDQKVEVWYAPSLGYLPVRSRITQANGDYVDQQLSALQRP